MSESNERIAAETFHVIEFIDDEVQARGWTRETLALRMGGDPARNLLAIELLDLEDPRCLLGDEMAAKLGQAFRTSKLLWLNLDRAWRQRQGVLDAEEIG